MKKQKLEVIVEDVVEEYDNIKSSTVPSKATRPAVKKKTKSITRSLLKNVLKRASTQKVIDNFVANAGEPIITKGFGI